MADREKRLRYYSGQFLQEQDFTDEQKYHLDRQRRHNRQLHGFGIAEGLTVTAAPGEASLTVSPGTAIDREGRMIVLTESRTVPFGSVTGWALVVISYHEETSNPATVGDEGDTRWWETPEVKVIAQAEASAQDESIQLARLHIDAGGRLDMPLDPAVRTSAGKLGVGTLKVQSPLNETLQFVKDQNDRQSPVMVSTTQVEVNTETEKAVIFKVVGKISSAPLIELRSGGNEASIRYLSLDEADRVPWHVGTGGAGGAKNFFFWNERQGVIAKITPEGDLSVAGKILVAGTVDGRDVAADGARLDALERSTLEGVSNPGGNVDLVGQNGITVTGDNTANTITIANPAGTLKLPGSLSDQLQFIKDQNDHSSPVMISSTEVEVNTEAEKASIFKVIGNISSAPLMEIRNRSNEASIRYLNLDNADKVAWHVGTGGWAGAKNFFFWNDSTGPIGKIVATITPEGDFSLLGKIVVAGTVDGRDVSADGAKLDNLERSTVGGVSNPGGDVKLGGQNGITVTGDNAAKTITIGNAAGSLKVANPLGPANQYVRDTSGAASGLSIGSGKHVGVGTETPGYLFTVAGEVQSAPLMEVHNVKDEASIRYRAVAGGTDWHVGVGGHGGPGHFFFWNNSNNQPKVVGTITPDGTLTLNGGLAVKTVQPQADAPVPGRLRSLLIDPTTGQVYNTDSPQRAVIQTSFTQADLTDTVKEIRAGFRPKHIALEGRAKATLGGRFYGGAVGGFCRCFEDKTFYATGHGPHVVLFDQPPYFSFFNDTIDHRLARVSFHELNVQVYLELIVENITDTGFNLKLFRSTDAGKTPPADFRLDLAFSILG